MSSIRVLGAATASLLAGCAWVLPTPSPRPLPEAAAAAYAACTLELTEARRALSTSLPGAGSAEPLILGLTDAPNDDRAVRDGSSIALHLAAGSGRAATRGEERVLALVELVGATVGTHAPIEDKSPIRLRSPGGDPGTPTGAAAGRAASTLVDGDVVIFKADTPNPNRPSTCDAMLRDGDFVYLKSLRRNAWITIENGRLAAREPHAGPASPCQTPKERCYTDRSGNLLCVNYFACDSESPR